MTVPGAGTRLLGGWLFFRTRFTLSAVVGLVVTAACASRWVSWVPEVVIDASRPARFVPLLEVAPAVYGLFLVVAFRPRLVVWERLRIERLRAHRAATAMLALLLPQLSLFVAARSLPPEAAPGPGAGWYWAWMPANVAVATASTLLLAAVLGAVTAASVVAAGYAAILAVQQVAPAAWAWLPLASGHHPAPRWLLAALLSGAAIVAWTRTGGARPR